MASSDEFNIEEYGVDAPEDFDFANPGFDTYGWDLSSPDFQPAKFIQFLIDNHLRLPVEVMLIDVEIAFEYGNPHIHKVMIAPWDITGDPDSLETAIRKFASISKRLVETLIEHFDLNPLQAALLSAEWMSDTLRRFSEHWGLPIDMVLAVVKDETERDLTERYLNDRRN